MIKNIVFDIGQVLKGWHPERLPELMGEKTGEAVRKAVCGNPLWQELDRGIMPEEEILSRMISENQEVVNEILYLWDHLEIISEKLDYAIPWLQELKDRGYGLYYLSNYSYHLRTTVPQTLAFLPLMDGGIFSYEAKLLKPDPVFYEMLLKTYRLVAEECIFIDDRAENVRAAEGCGMQGILFRDYESARIALEERLGERK